MKHYKVYYNDNVYLGTISFTDNYTRKQRQLYFIRYIKDNNTNCNKDYHINFRNIKRVF